MPDLLSLLSSFYLGETGANCTDQQIPAAPSDRDQWAHPARQCALWLVHAHEREKAGLQNCDPCGRQTVSDDPGLLPLIDVSAQELAPNPDVVNVPVTLYLQHHLCHATSCATGTAKNNRDGLGYLPQSASQLWQRNVDGSGGVAVGKLRS